MVSTTRAQELATTVVHLTEDEKSEIREMIRKGELPQNSLELQGEAEARNVSGENARKDKNGRYVEQGIGSKGHETLNHFVALQKAEREGLEPPGSYKRAVEELWKRDSARAKAIGLPPPPTGVAA